MAKKNKKFIPSPEEIKAFIKLSEDSLKSAQLRLEEDFFRGTVSDAYYAAFYIVKAALINKGIISKTHSGTINLFGENFVKNRQVDEKYGKWLKELLKERTDATYEALREFSHQEAKEALEQSEKFVKEIKKLVGK